MSLPYITQQITIYGSLAVCIAGIIGNSINILVFTSVRSYRTTPCTFYFLIASISNLIYITMFPISRVVTVGYGFDLSRTSTIWCKIRPFCGSVLALTSLSYTCLATVDQFFVTSQNAWLRRFSNIKWAHRIVVIVAIFWILHGIPILSFNNISPVTKSCINTNYDYSIYWPIYLISLLGVVPVLVMIVFGYLAYRNIHRTRVLAEQRADRQLTKMVLVEVALVIIAFFPLGSYNAYSLATSKISKGADWLAKENFFYSIISILCYLYFLGSCYMFLISSSRFRRTTKDRLLFRRQSSQVTPTQLRTGGTVILNRKTKTVRTAF